MAHLKCGDNVTGINGGVYRAGRAFLGDQGALSHVAVSWIIVR